MERKILKIDQQNCEAYVAALDAVLLSSCDALDVDTVWEALMSLRLRIAGTEFKYPPQHSKAPTA